MVDLAPLPRVEVDESRLGQIFVNLLMNAAQAIAPGHVADNAVTIDAREVGDTVVIEVRDTGCGMPPEVMKRVFEPFYTTKAVGVGTGLGLVICHGIVTSVGGRMQVESRVGEGSTFRVTLPRALRGVATAVPPPAVVEMPHRGRILAIDDEPMILKALGRMLREHQVVCVGSRSIPRTRVASCS